MVARDLTLATRCRRDVTDGGLGGCAEAHGRARVRARKLSIAEYMIILTNLVRFFLFSFAEDNASANIVFSHV